MVARRWLCAPSALVTLGALGWSAAACSAAAPTYPPQEDRACIVVPPECPIYDDSTFPCDEPSDCPSGLVCEDLELTSRWSNLCRNSLVCWPECDCVGGDLCQPDGTCRPPRCDEPDAPACPEHFRCDPEAQSNSPVASNSVVRDDEHLRHTFAAGCVRKRCDEPDGYACGPTYRCAPDETSDGSGCLPAPCAETGACPGNSVCTPVGEHPRTGPDQFGCYSGNCDDPGYGCARGNDHFPGDVASQSHEFVRICDFSHPLADRAGCVAASCTDPSIPCPEGMVCDPESPTFTSSSGCRFPRCPDEFDCSDGWHCDIANPIAEKHGCVSGGGADVTRRICN